MKRFILILIGILFIGIIAFFVFISIDMKKAKEAGETVSLRDYFPFGKGSGSRVPIFKKENNTIDKENGDEEVVDIADESLPRLRKIVSEPVAGYGFSKREIFDGEEKDLETVTVTPYGIFEKELSFGSKGDDVLRLQKTLNDCPDLGLSSSGPGSRGQETTTFSNRTLDAVKRFQLKFKDEILTPRNLQEPTGVLDELTRRKISAPFVCQKSDQQIGGKEKTTIRYTLKENGNISDYIPETNTEYRVTNTTIPQIAEAYFINNGTKVLLRYLGPDDQTIINFLGTIPTQRLGEDQSENTLKGKILSEDIVDVVPNNDTNEIYIETFLSNEGIGLVRDLETKKQTKIWQHPFTEWLAQWINNNVFMLTTKASGYVPGALYMVKNGSFEKILGSINGLTTNTSMDGKFVFFSRSISGGIESNIFNKENNRVYTTDIRTLPEKCVWTKNGQTLYCANPHYIENAVYPDDWYQGKIRFSDSLWQLDPSRLLNDVELINMETETGEAVDAIDVRLTPDEKYLIFRNKNDYSLWLYQL